MRDRLLHHRLLTVAAATLAFAAAWSATARADDAQVTVVSPSGHQQTLSLEALAEDVVEHAYALRSATGESSLTVTGFSPGAILAAAGADPFGFSYLEVQRPAGGSVLLSRHQALDPGAFPEGPPVVYATPAGTGFLRPSAGPEDLNAADSFEAPQGVAIVLRKGSPLQVRASASTLRTRPGGPVVFAATVEGAGAGEQLSYSWYFDDGASSTGARTRHRFARRGSYDVVVGVTTPGDDTGASAVVTVQVGAPLSGPDRKGGGRNRDSAAPDHGAASAPGPPAPPTTPSNPPSSSRSSSRFCSHSETKCELDRRKPDGVRVSGVLLGGARASSSPEGSPAARTGRLNPEGAGGGLPDAVLGLLATAGLLGLGAMIEARGSLSARRAGGGTG